MDSAPPEEKRFKSEALDPHFITMLSPTPTDTLLVANIPPMSLHEIVQLFERFGFVVGVVKVCLGSAVLVQYGDVSTCVQMVQKSQTTPFFVGPNMTSLYFSNVTLAKSSSTSSNDGPKVLRLHIQNAIYPITVNVINAICSSHAQLVRILIGNKEPDNSVEALCEFKTNADAVKIMETLQGADIYSGCCTLEIAFSQLVYLQVVKNDSCSWDYSSTIMPASYPVPSIESTANGLPPVMPPLQMVQPPPAMLPSPFGMMPPVIRGIPIKSTTGVNILVFRPNLTADAEKEAKIDPKDLLPYEEGDGLVLTILHLTPNVNCDMLFNLFCMYGNVARIKFLMSKPGTALIQMGTKEQADNAIQHYDGKILFGNKIEVLRSKYTAVQPANNPLTLTDGTASHKDYQTNINNRFMTHALAAKNKILPPSAKLHYFNCPPPITFNDVREILLALGCKPAMKVLLFQSKKPNIKTNNGLVEYSNVSDALATMALANHCELRLEDKPNPYHLKFSYNVVTE